LVRYSSVETDDTYHEYFNSTLNDYMYILDNPNFYQRYHNDSGYNIYAENYGLMRHMGVLGDTYFNVTVFNNNSFSVNSVTLLGQIRSRGSYMNWWGALIDYVMQPNETYLFPVAEAELPSYAYATGYITNSTLQMSNPLPTPAPSPTPSSAIGALISPLTIAIIVAIVVLVAVIISPLFYRRHRKVPILSKRALSMIRLLFLSVYVLFCELLKVQ
jgi:hypothetical protein